jgi:hypothetical protein
MIKKIYYRRFIKQVPNVEGVTAIEAIRAPRSTSADFLGLWKASISEKGLPHRRFEKLNVLPSDEHTTGVKNALFSIPLAGVELNKPPIR